MYGTEKVLVPQSSNRARYSRVSEVDMDDMGNAIKKLAKKVKSVDKFHIAMLISVIAFISSVVSIFLVAFGVIPIGALNGNDTASSGTWENSDCGSYTQFQTLCPGGFRIDHYNQASSRISSPIDFEMMVNESALWLKQDYLVMIDEDWDESLAGLNVKKLENGGMSLAPLKNKNAAHRRHLMDLINENANMSESTLAITSLVPTQYPADDPDPGFVAAFTHMSGGYAVDGWLWESDHGYIDFSPYDMILQHQHIIDVYADQILYLGTPGTSLAFYASTGGIQAQVSGFQFISYSTNGIRIQGPSDDWQAYPFGTSYNGQMKIYGTGGGTLGIGIDYTHQPWPVGIIQMVSGTAVYPLYLQPSGGELHLGGTHPSIGGPYDYPMVHGSRGLAIHQLDINTWQTNVDLKTHLAFYNPPEDTFMLANFMGTYSGDPFDFDQMPTFATGHQAGGSGSWTPLMILSAYSPRERMGIHPPSDPGYDRDYDITAYIGLREQNNWAIGKNHYSDFYLASQISSPSTGYSFVEFITTRYRPGCGIELMFTAPDGVFINGVFHALSSPFGMSDERIKKDIVDVTPVDGLTKVLQLLPKKYKYTPEFTAYSGHGANDEAYGFISQEVEIVVPEAVKEVDGQNYVRSENMTGSGAAAIWPTELVETKLKTLQKDQLIALLVAAVKQLNVEIVQLKQHLGI